MQGGTDSLSLCLCHLFAVESGSRRWSNARPHPSPLPRGEGEFFAVSWNVVSRIGFRKPRNARRLFPAHESAPSPGLRPPSPPLGAGERAGRGGAPRFRGSKREVRLGEISPGGEGKGEGGRHTHASTFKGTHFPAAQTAPAIASPASNLVAPAFARPDAFPTRA